MCKRLINFICCASFILFVSGYAFGAKLPATAEKQQSMTPNEVLQTLKSGNERFVSDHDKKINYLHHVKLTASSQHPVAIVLSCIDSRVPPEIIFNQPIGNLFVTRTAANVINKDVIGGMEFATRLAGAKLIVVMGHDSCGAVTGACKNVKLGKLTGLLDKIHPAIKETEKQYKKKACQSSDFINSAAKNNVLHVMKQLPEKSSVIRQLVKSGKVKIVGAMYHLDSGKVTFFN